MKTIKTVAVTALVATAFTIVGLFVGGKAEAEFIQNQGTLGEQIKQLQDWGYTVALQSQADVRYLTENEKSLCLVTQVNPVVSGPPADGMFQTIYLSATCPTYGGSNTDSGSSDGSSSSSGSS